MHPMFIVAIPLVRSSDRRHGIEQHRAGFQSTAEFVGARSGKEGGGGKGRLPPFL